MPISDFIKGVKKKSPVKKKSAKKKSCKDCVNFKDLKNINFEDEYFYKSGINKGTIVFLLSPISFDSLKRFSWTHIITSGLSEYNILFLPYPKCQKKMFSAKEKHTVNTLRICKDNFIIPQMDKFNPDLIVVFHDTIRLLEVDKDFHIQWEGNWGLFHKRRVYYAKDLYSIEKKGFDSESFHNHTVQKIHKFFDGKLIWQRNPDFRRVTTIESLNNIKDEILSQEMVAVDVETSGLNVLEEGFVLKTIAIYWPKTAVCIAYEVKEGSDLKYQREVRKFCIALFQNEDIEKDCHNLKYEMKVFMAKMQMEDFNNCGDTMFRSYLFDENKRSNALKYLAGLYSDGYNHTDIDFKNSTYEDLFFYNCLDAYFTYNLRAITFEWDKLHPNLRDGIQYVYDEVMIPLCHELAVLEINGVKVDFEYVQEIKKQTEKEIKDILKKIADEFPQTRNRDLNSPKQLGDILFVMLKYPVIRQTDKGANSTDQETLITLKEQHNCKLADYLLQYKDKTKQLSTYILPYIEKRDQFIGGRVRSDYMQVKNYSAMKGQAKGTVTGRLSSANPNLQNVKRSEFIKKMFIPSGKDRVILQADLSQAELRIAGSLAFEETILEVYNKGEDIHTKTGNNLVDQKEMDEILKLQVKERKKKLKELRYTGKTANFALLYLGGFKVLQSIAKKEFNLVLSDEQAQNIRERFFEIYSGLVTWHESTKGFIKTYGYSLSPFGRVRRLNDIFKYNEYDREYHAIMNQGVNSPVQSACADFLAQIWVRAIREIRRRKLDAFVVLTVHDSLDFDCHKDCIDEVIEILTEATAYWEKIHQKYWLKCPMKMDFEIGKNWGELREI